jgi:two-component system, OmpR family, sensor histidine kinase CiaH
MLHSRRTFHLALTYLAIMMTLSIGFSVIFFYTSAGSLSVNIQHAPSQAVTGPRVGNVHTVDGKNTPTTAGADPDKELASRLSAVQQDLAQRLIALNIGVFVAGSFLSYFLARRTLRPIEQSIERQARFSSDASHELRTPLTALRTRAEVTLRKQTVTLAEAKAALENNVEQAVQLEELADALLRLSQDDTQPLHVKHVKVKDVVSKAAARLGEKARSKHITLQYDIVSTLVIIAEADSLIQIISILLDNAIKYSPEGSTIRIGAHTDSSKIAVTIQDQGIGIDEGDLPHIFERFYRADKARRHDGHSYGLGLSIAQQLAKRNKGTITASSEPGRGTLFTVTLRAV